MLKNVGKQVTGSSFQGTNFIWVTSITRVWVTRLENRLNIYYYSLLMTETSAFDLKTIEGDKDRH